MKAIIIDATNATFGRLASFAAKQALLGKSVTIVNCKQAIITGNRATIMREFKIMRNRGGASQNGPIYPTNPERILKRAIRGMLPYKQGRGADAFDKIRCYNTTPKEFEAAKKIHAGKEKMGSKTTLKEDAAQL